MRIPKYEWQEPRLRDTCPRPEWQVEFGLSPLWQQLILAREVEECQPLSQFISPTLADIKRGLDRLPELEKIAAGLLEAGRERQPVLVYSDYDADGVVAGFISMYTLYELGVPVNIFIPDRQRQGYGLHLEPLLTAHRRGYRHILALDVGTSDPGVVAEAREAGLEVYVVDHHRPGVELPQCTLANPVLLGDEQFLPCSAGLALLLAMELYRQAGREWDEKLEGMLVLAGLATVGDVVPLVGFNRHLAKLSLERLAAGPDWLPLGMRALLEKARLAGKRVITAWDVAMRIVPRLNAPGRMADANLVFRALWESDPHRAGSLVESLEQCNQSRRSIQERVEREALLLLREHYPDGPPEVVVLAGEEWHCGVVGIVAAHIANRVRRPTLLLTAHAARPGTLHGSGRSFGGVDLKALLDEVAGEAGLIRWGGHPDACGLTVPRQNLGHLVEACQRARAASTRVDQQEVRVDGYLTPQDGPADLLTGFEKLHPFGEGFPEPHLIIPTARVVGHSLVGSDKTHLRLKVSWEGEELELIGFRLSHLADSIGAVDGAFDLLVRLGVDEFRSELRPRLELRDLRPA